VDEGRLAHALTGLVGATLAKELAADFVKIRRDYATKTLERASPGKFVETFVQCLQRISTGKHDAEPNVDNYLNTRVENEAALPDGLRLCGGRIARSMYTLRNKRNIVHKGVVDPNTFDLAFVHQGAAWIMAEMIRCASGIRMEEAGALIELVQAPVGTLVEEIDGTRLVHADVSARTEILILLHSHYPDRVAAVDILKTMSGRSAASVRSRLSELRIDKLIFGDAKTGYRLTQPGYATAVAEIERLQN
jgi:hypothetical protein